MDLRELRYTVSRHLPVALVVLAVCVGLGLVASYLPERTYRTSSTILVDVNADAETGGTVQYINFLLPSLQEEAESRALRDAARPTVPEEFQRRFVPIEAISSSSVLRIRGSSSSPEAAAAWVNAVSEQLVLLHPADDALSLNLLDEASVPRRAVSPQVAPIMVASVVLGLIAALFAALAAERVKRAFDTGQAVRERLGTTVLGEIPAMKRRKERRFPTITLLDGRHPSVDLMAAFESVRANVELRMKETGADKIAIVSLQRHQGKSTVSAGLSYALATVGRKVVAIEADLRNPTLAEQLDVRPSQGIGDIAAYGRTEVSLQATSHPFLEFLSAGIPVGQAAHVVNSTLPSVLEAVAADGRLVIVDSPPFRGAPESAVVVAHAEHAILVVASGSIDFDSMSEAIDRINEAGGSLLGVVINKVPRRRAQQDHYRTGAFSRRLGVSEVSDDEPSAEAVNA